MSFKKLEEAEDDIFLSSPVAQVNRPVTVTEIMGRAEALRLECDRAYEAAQRNRMDYELVENFLAAALRYSSYLEKEYVSQ